MFEWETLSQYYWQRFSFHLKSRKQDAWCIEYNGRLLFLLDGDLYTGTVADFSGMDPIIYREPLQTEQYDSMSLNGKFYIYPIERISRNCSSVLEKENRVSLYSFWLISITLLSFSHSKAPDFVSSITQRDFVYFFFRETAVEYINCGKVSCLFDNHHFHLIINNYLLIT